MANTTNSLQSLISQAEQKGFESYGSFNEGILQHEILTCLEGEHNNEVIDIYWEYKTGKVVEILHSCQFKGQTPTFKFS